VGRSVGTLVAVDTPLGSREREDWPAWTGWLIAGLWVALAVALTVDPAMPDRSRGWSALLLGLAALPFVLDAMGRMGSPALHAAMVLIPLAIYNLAGEPLGLYDATGHSAAAVFAAIFLAGQLCATAPTRTMAVGLVAVLAIVVGRGAFDSDYHAEGLWVAGTVMAASAGAFMRSQVTSLRALRAAQAQLARQAAVEERQRVAREVHDVIAHSLTVTMLHLSAARLAVGRDDSVAATEALEEAERAGRQSLAEIRRTVGLLRDGEDGASEAPLPVAADVVELVDGYRSAGMDVHLEIDGDLDVMAPAASLATYRVVQEALANSARHAPGARATVDVTVNGGVSVSVASRGGASSHDPGKPHRQRNTGAAPASRAARAVVGGSIPGSARGRGASALRQPGAGLAPHRHGGHPGGRSNHPRRSVRDVLARVGQPG